MTQQVVALGAFLMAAVSPPAERAPPEPRFSLTVPAVVLTSVPFEVEIGVLDERGHLDLGYDGTVSIRAARGDDSADTTLMPAAGPFVDGRLRVTEMVITDRTLTRIVVGDETGEVGRRVRVLPGLASLLPPALAIALALIFREVLLALFGGVWLGATLIHENNPVWGLLRGLDHYIVGALSDSDHAAVIIFSMTLGGMVGVISRAGGTEGIVAALSRWTQNPRGGQLATWAMGVAIFFDDYANTLIVGNTLRPLTDRLRISREKLSFIVDATAAPVTSVAVISSWIGFQVGLIDQAFKEMGAENDAYVTFLASIPYASYSILMAVFVFLVGMTLRDFGPMRRAEERAVTTGNVLAEGARPLVDDKLLDITAAPGTPRRWFNAAIPILVVILATLAGLYLSGRAALADQSSAATLGQIIGAANSFHVLMWASFLGAFVAVALAIGQKILGLRAAVEAWLGGVKAMVMAMVILVLAWAIGKVCGDLGTAAYVIEQTRELLSPHWLPLLTFVIAAFVSFATGTSWATMAILTPIVVPMAVRMTGDAHLAVGETEGILLGSIGGVLSGAVFGDHCSPISDTTIMSSMTSAADHIDHVRTQLPYAVTVAAVACLVGYGPAGLGWPPGISLLAGGVVLAGLLFVLGRRRG